MNARQVGLGDTSDMDEADIQRFEQAAGQMLHFAPLVRPYPAARAAATLALGVLALTDEIRRLRTVRAPPPPQML